MVCLLWPGLAACRKKQPVVALPPPVTVPQPTESDPDPEPPEPDREAVHEPSPELDVPLTPHPPTSTELAAESFGEGNCEQTIAFMEEVVEGGSIDDQVEIAIPLALCYVSGPLSARNRLRATELLSWISQRASPVDRQQANLILRLLEDLQNQEISAREQSRRIRKLEQEVEGLKEIDIRRRPERLPRD